MKQTTSELEMDADQLYREEVITDLRIGTIRCLIPVTVDGRRDEAREVRYSGQTQVMTPAGPMPISFDIDASNLAQAVQGFAAAAETALEETARELEEYRRKAASGIVVPGAEDVSRLGGSGLIKP